MKNNFLELTLDEMIVKREELRRRLFDTRVRIALGQVNNPVELRIMRRQIARLNTRIHNFVEKQYKE